MSIAAEKVAELLALPDEDRAFLARQLIASLDDTVEPDAETEWNEVIDRRSREMAEGNVDARPEEEMLQDIRTRLHARHSPSCAGNGATAPLFHAERFERAVPDRERWHHEQSS